ncbi:MAG: class I SAM-dependent methyltransferase, partial [Bacteroidales bacterium]|nr:class I SAM-dependent methyltransferase [Bacteroidales bacterium]
YPSKEVLASKYDFITCTEVIEHFYNPLQEFKKLHEMLLPGGKLFCMTNIYSSEINFSKWHYKNDMTHVFIYAAKTLALIAETIGFKDITIDDKLITFTKA